MIAAVSSAAPASRSIAGDARAFAGKGDRRRLAVAPARSRGTGPEDDARPFPSSDPPWLPPVERRAEWQAGPRRDRTTSRSPSGTDLHPPGACDPDRPRRERATAAALALQGGRCLTRACRRTSRGSPRPRRRTCPSTRRRSRPCAAPRGRAPARRLVEHDALAWSRSSCRVVLSLSTSARSASAASLMCLRRRSARRSGGQRLPGAAVGQEPEAVPHVVGQRAVFLHFVELGRVR